MDFLKDNNGHWFRADDIRELYIRRAGPVSPWSGNPHTHAGYYRVLASLYESGWTPGFANTTAKIRQVSGWFAEESTAQEALDTLIRNLKGTS